MTNWTFTDTYLVGRKIVPFVTAPAEQNHSDRRRTGAWGDEHFPGGRPWRIPGRVNPLAEPARGWVRRHFSNKLVSGQRLRVIRYGRKCLGVDFRLVCSSSRERNRPRLLWSGSQPTHLFEYEELRSQAARNPHSPQGPQRRFAPLRSKLLFALPSRCPPAADGRHRNEPPRLSLHHAGSRTCRRKSCRLPSLKLRSR